MTDKWYPLLAEAIPAARVLLKGLVEFGVAAERRGERGLVVGRAPVPTPSQPRPGGDCVAPGDKVLGRARRDKVLVREAAPLGRRGQHICLFRMIAVQGIVEPRDHPRRIAESGMLGDVLYPRAIDPHLAAVVEAVEKFLSGV